MFKQFSVLKLFLCLLLYLVPIIIYGQKTAKPLTGEGVYSFLKRHNYVEKDDYSNFIELNKRKLGKNNSLLANVNYQLPSKSSTKKTTNKISKNEPLFGEVYSKYTIESDKLKGACFFLSSGHGGPDPGCIGKIGKTELHEDEYAYDITLRLARHLLREGATVHIIIQDKKDGIRNDKYLSNSNRETCMGDPIPLNQKKRLQQRCNKINSLSKKAKEKYQRAIFLHLDSRNKAKRVDVYFYHCVGSPEGKRLANNLKNTFQRQYDKHQPSRGFRGTVGERGLFVLSNAKPVAVFTELGNIQNDFDQKRFLESSNREALANWLKIGLIKDYEDYKKRRKK